MACVILSSSPVVAQVYGVQLVVVHRIEKARQLVVRRFNQDQVGAIAKVKDSSEGVAAQVQVRQRAGTVAPAQAGDDACGSGRPASELGRNELSIPARISA